MSDQGLPSLEDLFDENFGDGYSDQGDGPVVSDEPIVETPVEQSDDISEEPAKLSDLFKEDLPLEEETQSDDGGQAESGPIDLDTEIEIDGQKITVRELARQRDEMRKDYTQKTQALSDERQAFETEREELQAAKDIRDMLKDSPVETIAEMALRAGIITEDTYQEALRSNRTLRTDDIIPERKSNANLEETIQEEVERRIAEALAKDPMRQQYAVQELQNRVSSTFSAIEESHGVELDDDDRRVIMQQAVAMNEGNLEFVFLKLNEQLRKQQANTDRVKQGAPKRSQRGPTPQDGETARPEKFDSLRDAWRFVEANIGA